MSWTTVQLRENLETGKPWKMATPAPIRRFQPEPYETLASSSRKISTAGDDESTKRVRRFSPQPIEMTSRSSRKSNVEESNGAPKPRRRFAPQPVETTMKSNRKQPPTEPSTGRRRFAPQLIETTTRNHRTSMRDAIAEESDSSSMASPVSGRSSTDGTPSKTRRKFAPQLIETSKRSRKAGDDGPAVLPSDRTEAVPAPRLAIPRHIRDELSPEPPVNTPTGAAPDINNELSQIMEARRLGKPIPARSVSRSSHRSHSFRVPDLDTIESSQSEGSSPPSLSTSPSAGSDKSYMYKHATRIRESVDDRYSGYLLEIAAKAAEKQLQEQAMAAFPNDDHHEPVDHFIDRDSDEYTTTDQDTESSFTQINWELREMQQYRRRLSSRKTEDRKVAEKLDAKAKEVARSPWRDPAAALGAGWQRGKEEEEKKSEARPPMLGSNILFPRCSSPEPARFDVTQGCDKLKESMCYLSEQCQQMEDQGKEGLWARKCTNGSQPEHVTISMSSTPSKGGLWGGCCTASKSQSRGRSGLMTPRVAIATPIATPCPTPSRNNFPSSYSSGQNDYFSGINEKLQFEQTIEEEFNDAFVTQVYNYLALGYPAIARNFDDELSKISRIEMPDLRHDDELAQSRGYIRLGEDGVAGGVAEDSCMRWRALRTYIREWAKQQPRMVSGAHALGGFGVGARRGSWAN